MSGDEKNGTQQDEPKVLRFARSRKEIPVVLVDEKTDEEVQYTLVELLGEKRVEYLNFMKGKQEVRDGKVVGIKNANRIESYLLSMSLIGPDGKHVDEKEITQWPSHTINGLFKEAMSLSCLTDDAYEKEKN